MLFFWCCDQCRKFYHLEPSAWPSQEAVTLLRAGLPTKNKGYMTTGDKPVSEALLLITLTTHITWFVSVFWDDCSVSSILRCRLILKFLSRWASFCCTSRWWKDSLGNKVLNDNAWIYMYKRVYYKKSKKNQRKVRISSGICNKKPFVPYFQFVKKKNQCFFASSHVPRENPGREPGLVERYMLRQPTLCSANAIWNWATLVKITICPEMHTVTKLADLMKFHQTECQSKVS